MRFRIKYVTFFPCILRSTRKRQECNSLSKITADAAHARGRRQEGRIWNFTNVSIPGRRIFGIPNRSSRATRLAFRSLFAVAQWLETRCARYGGATFADHSRWAVCVSAKSSHTRAHRMQSSRSALPGMILNRERPSIRRSAHFKQTFRP